LVESGKEGKEKGPKVIKKQKVVIKIKG